MAQWRVEMLGGLRVVGDRVTVTHFESRKTAALLAYLALHPDRLHPREELAAVIWPDIPYELGRNRLKQSLASLRRQLETTPGSVFDTDRFAVRVQPGAFTTDVAQWEALVRATRFADAAELWRGELLPGFYDDALLVERERLNALQAQLPTPDRWSRPRRDPLPAPLTRLYGRAQEKAQINVLLTERRWLTLIGVGGIGKTRLALEIARSWDVGEVVFVPLAQLTSVEQAPRAVASALNLPLPDSDPIDAICGFLDSRERARESGSARRETLLIFDNAEQLDPAALAILCQKLLERVPALRLLVTSRQVLGGDAEAIYPVPPLPVPIGEDQDNPSIALFLDRGRQVCPELDLSPAVVGLCQLLEGMPLALELCAAWAIALTPDQMQERLKFQDPSLLTARSNTGESRHRSVRTVFLSSYERLTPARQGLLRGLCVFRGGWTLDAAGAVCPTTSTLDDLIALQEASFVVRAPGGRFSMLESLRQFADSLLADDERQSLAQRHAVWCDTLPKTLLSAGDEEVLQYGRLDPEFDNLRAAIEGRLVRGESEAAVALIVRLGLYLSLRGHGDLALRWLEMALGGALCDATRIEALIRIGSLCADRRGPQFADSVLAEALNRLETTPIPRLKAQAIWLRGRLAYLRHDFAASRSLHLEALALRQSIGDSEGEARSLHALGQLASHLKDFENARSLLADAERVARAIRRTSLLTDILLDRARLMQMLQDFATARTLLEECGRQAERLGLPRLMAKVANNAGDVAGALGDSDEARRRYLDAARTFIRLREWMISHFPLWNLACLYGEWGEHAIGLSVMACAVRLWEDTGRPLSDDDVETIGRMRAASESVLGADQTEFFWQQGHDLHPDDAILLIESQPRE